FLRRPSSISPLRASVSPSPPRVAASHGRTRLQDRDRLRREVSDHRHCRLLRGALHRSTGHQGLHPQPPPIV
ncbi:unnamed protein product, partial [Musa banksii]